MVVKFWWPPNLALSLYLRGRLHPQLCLHHYHQRHRGHHNHHPQNKTSRRSFASSSILARTFSSRTSSTLSSCSWSSPTPTPTTTTPSTTCGRSLAPSSPAARTFSSRPRAWNPPPATASTSSCHRCKCFANEFQKLHNISPHQPIKLLQMESWWTMNLLD